MKKLTQFLFLALATLSMTACRANLGNLFDLY